MMIWVVDELAPLGGGAVISIAEAAVSALAGTALGWWLANYSAAARTRAEARSAARQAMARLHQLIWPPTRYPEFLSGLDALDAELLLARVSPELRAALSLVASECWTDGAETRGQLAPGISTELLVGFRTVRNAILAELATGSRRGAAHRRASAVFAEVDDLVARDRADRGLRTPPVLAADLAAQTLDASNR